MRETILVHVHAENAVVMLGLLVAVILHDDAPHPQQRRRPEHDLLARLLVDRRLGSEQGGFEAFLALLLLSLLPLPLHLLPPLRVGGALELFHVRGHAHGFGLCELAEVLLELGLDRGQHLNRIGIVLSVVATGLVHLDRLVQELPQVLVLLRARGAARVELILELRYVPLLLLDLLLQCVQALLHALGLRLANSSGLVEPSLEVLEGLLLVLRVLDQEQVGALERGEHIQQVRRLLKEEGHLLATGYLLVLALEVLARRVFLSDSSSSPLQLLVPLLLGLFHLPLGPPLRPRGLLDRTLLAGLLLALDLLIHLPL
mmetsp:Transcript_103425/g.297100  ORF Transcript_103425/g.297100 Transcript_103425/m.297100 type:complete len:316 (+) Transcript_103425:144-1091(+)